MRILRMIIWLIALIALIAMGCVVALYFLINPTSVEKKIQDTLAPYGYAVKANELPQVRVLPNISISLPPAKLVNENNREVLFYRNAQFQISPLWLVFGKFYIDELKIDGLAYENRLLPSFEQCLTQFKTDKTAIFDDVTIAKISLSDADIKIAHEDKSVNLLNLRAEIGEPSPQMHGVISLSGQAQIQPNNLLLDVESAFELDLNLAEGRVGLGNFILRANGTEAALPVSLTASSPLLKLTSDTFYASTALVEVKRSTYQTQVSVAELNIIPHHWQAPDVNAKVVAQTPNGEVKFDIRSPFNYDGVTNALIADHLQGSLTLPGMDEPSSVSGNLSANLTQESAQLEVFGRLHDAPMSFSGTVNGFDHPNIQGSLVLGRLKLQDIRLLSALNVKKELTTDTPSEPVQEAPAASEPTATVTPAPTQEEGQTPTENVSEVAPASTESVVETQPVEKPEAVVAETVTPEPATNTTPEAPQADFQFLSLFDFNGQVVIGELISDKLRLIQVKSPVVVANGEMKLPSITALAYDGRFFGHMSLNQNGLWETSFKSSGVNLQQLLTDAGASSAVPGSLNVQANLYGNGFELNLLNGQVGFAVSNSLVRGLDLPKALKDIEQGRSPKSDNKQQTDIQQIKGLATLSQSSAQVEDLTVALTGATVSGNAQIDLTTDLLRGELAGPSRRGLKVRLYLSDTWYQPKVSMNDEEIKTLNQIQVRPKEAEPEEKSSKWDRFKQFFSDRF